MRAALTISLPAIIAEQVAQICRDDGMTRSEFIKLAIKRQIIAREMQNMRRDLTPYAQLAGWLTDDDVMREVS